VLLLREGRGKEEERGREVPHFAHPLLIFFLL